MFTSVNKVKVGNLSVARLSKAEYLRGTVPLLMISQVQRSFSKGLQPISPTALDSQWNCVPSSRESHDLIICEWLAENQ